MTKRQRSQVKRGRPRVESKKKPYQVMLDPRYVKHAAAFSKGQGMTIQDLFRLVLGAVVPDPFTSVSVSFDQLIPLREKAISFAATQQRRKYPIVKSEGVAQDRRP
jgi:hypothetical protein